MQTMLVSAAWRAFVLMLALAGVAAAPAAAGPTATSPPAISGPPTVGVTLSATPGAWAGAQPTTFTYRWQRCVEASYGAEVLRDGPMAYYRLGDTGESAVLTDAAGNERLGTFRNGVLREVDGGPFEDGDGAVGFDGVDDLADVPDAPGLDLGDAFSLEAWIRPAGGRLTRLLDKGVGAYALRQTAADRIVLTKPGAGDVAAATAPVPRDGGYHHVVATKNGASVRIYLNGADVTGPVTNRTFVDNASVLRLGAAHAPLAGEERYRGELDEVALYRGALAAARVRAHYDVGSAGCVPIAGAQASSYALGAADHGTTLRVLVRATDASGSTTAASEETGVVGSEVPVSVDPPVVWGEPVVGQALVAGEGAWAGSMPLAYALQWQSCLDRRYRATVLADFPAGYWRLGELSATIANDDSGRGNRGTYVNGVALGVPGALTGSVDTNRAARFDGVNDHVTVADRSSLDLGDSLTIEEWVRRGVLGARGQIVQKGVGGYALRVDSDDRVSFAKSNVQILARSSVAIPADGAYHHVVATKDGPSARVYVDGVDVTAPVANATVVDNNAPLLIGRFTNHLTGASSNAFGGDLDEVALYDKPLSAVRVREHYEMGTGGCADIPGAVGTTYTPAPSDVGRRLRIVARAENDLGSATATSARTHVEVATSRGPAIVAGTLSDKLGNPVAGAAVTLHVWPADADAVSLSEGAAAETTQIAQATTDANGNYALEADPAGDLQAAVDSSDGIVNLELRARANGLQYTTFLERDFGTPEADSLAEGGSMLAEAEAAAVWQDSATGLPAASTNAILGPAEAGVAAVQADPPTDGVPDCSSWDKTFTIWKKTGQGEEPTRVGELHTWSTMTNRFAYGARADSSIDVAFKTPTSRWFVNGSVHIGNSSTTSTVAEVSATTGVGEYTSRAVRARFIYTHWYQCGTGNRKTRAAKWNGYSLGKGVRLSSRDGECSNLKPWIFESGQSWERDRYRAVHWGVAVDLGFFSVGARSGYSSRVRSKWWFGNTLASTTLCGVKKYPGDAQRVFAGW